MKDVCQKWKVKLIFRGAYRLSWTGIVECLEIIDVECNLEQFDGLTWLSLIPHIYVTSIVLNIGAIFLNTKSIRDSGEIAVWPYAIDNKAQPIVKCIFIGPVLRK